MFRAVGNELDDRLSGVYRDLHAHPELSFAEHRTGGIAAGWLKGLGFEVLEGIGKTGVAGVRDHRPRGIEDADPGVPEKRRGGGQLLQCHPAPVRFEEALREVRDLSRVGPQVRALLPPDVALHDGKRQCTHQRDGQQDEKRVACRKPPPDGLEHSAWYLFSECRRVRPRL